MWLRIIGSWFTLDWVAERFVERQLICWDTSGEKKPAMRQHRAESQAEEAESTKIWSLIQFGILEEGVKNRLAGMCSAKEHGTRYIWQWLANPFTLYYQLLENRARIIFEFASLILSLIYGTWSTNMCGMTKLNKPFPKVIYRTLGIFIYNRPSVSHLFQYGWSCGPWKRRYLLGRATCGLTSLKNIYVKSEPISHF